MVKTPLKKKNYPKSRKKPRPRPKTPDPSRTGSITQYLYQTLINQGYYLPEVSVCSQRYLQGVQDHIYYHVFKS